MVLKLKGVRCKIEQQGYSGHTGHLLVGCCVVNIAHCIKETKKGELNLECFET